MSLTKSPAGVPWKYGIDGIMREETRIYTDRLADLWATDPQRVTAIEGAGLPVDQARAACKMAAVALWGDACKELQGAAQPG